MTVTCYCRYPHCLQLIALALFIGASMTNVWGQEVVAPVEQGTSQQSVAEASSAESGNEVEPVGSTPSGDVEATASSDEADPAEAGAGEVGSGVE